MRRLFLAVALLAVDACRCGPPPRPLAPQLEVLEDMSAAERTSVDFGFVQVNITGKQTVRIRNSGTALLSISMADTTPAEFGVGSTLPFEVNPGDDGQLELTFTPTVPDQRVTGTVTLTSNDPSRMTYTLQLAGQGVTAVARPTPASLNFMDVYVGESKTLMLTLTNAGGNALPVRGASITGNPMAVTGNFTAFTNVMIPAGGSATVPVTFAPMVPQMGAITGAVVIDIDAMYGGSVTVPITGRATQAIPRMCFKFDDEAMERCTDSITTSLTLNFGALCDNRLYASGPNACTPQNGQRSGRMYFRNEGNIPIPYSAQYTPYIYPGGRCDGGESTWDFQFSNAAPVPDGGFPASVTVATMPLPANEMAPRPWESMPVTITYRAQSACRAEAADQARVIWTRQDPVTTMPIRMPGTLFATLTGTSLLPSVQPKPVNIGQAGQPADVPLSAPIPVELVSNEGAAPVQVTAVDFYEEFTNALPDGGSLLQQCTPAQVANEFSSCSRFQWAPGMQPMLPVTLDGGGGQRTLGRIFVGCAGDGGNCPLATTTYKIFAGVSTSDPYAPRVDVPITAVVRYLP